MPNINSNHEQIPILFEKSTIAYLPYFEVNIKNILILIYRIDYLLEVYFAIIFLLSSSLYLYSGSSLSIPIIIGKAKIKNKIRKITKIHGKSIISVINNRINVTQNIVFIIILTSMPHFINYRKTVKKFFSKGEKK